MKKSLTALAVAAAIAAPMAASADSTVYGRIHISVDQYSDSGLTMDAATNKANAIGVKGSKDTNLADFKAVYKGEAGFNINDKEALTKLRDTWVGLSSKTMGTVRMGAMATSYKQSGKAVDPFYLTTAQGRGPLGIQSSSLHGGTGENRGRATRTVRYDSPKMGGLKIAAGYSIVDKFDDNMNLGIHYSGGGIFAFVDYIALGETATKDAHTATKIGAKWKGGPIAVGFQYEIDGGAVSGADDGEGNILFLGGSYTMGSTSFLLSYGMKDDTDGETGTGFTDDSHTAFALGVSQSLAKGANAYLGYGARSGDVIDQIGDENVITVGMNVKF